MPRVRKPSQPTSLYWPCSFNNPCHKEMPIALPIMKGAQFCFTRCGNCGGNLFFPSSWPVTLGLTEKQASAAGLKIITNVKVFKTKAPAAKAVKTK